MKKSYFLLILCYLHLPAGAQTPAIRQVYAWAQPVLGGARPTVQQTDGGNEISTQGSKTNYFFYAEPVPKANFTWCRIWLRNGGYFKIKTDTVAAIPSMLIEEQENGVRLVKDLVPENTSPVIQLTPGNSVRIRAKNAAWLNRLMKDNELIIVYIYKGKTWYHPVEKIKMPDAVPGS